MPSPTLIFSAVDSAPLVAAERLLGGQLERHGLARDDLHERAALRPGEDVAIDGRAQRALGSTVLDGREVRGVEPGSE